MPKSLLAHPALARAFALALLFSLTGSLGAPSAIAPSASAAPPADAEQPTAAAPAELATWVQELGHRDFGVREEATRKIREMGLPAKPALVAALRDDDPEIRLRARRCLADILDADYQARLRAFETGKTGSQAELSGWSRYRTLVGEDTHARSLFVQMHKAEAGLLESAAAGGSLAADAILLRCQQSLQISRVPNATLRQQPSLGTVAALLFVSADPQLKLPEQTQSMVFNFVNQSSFQTALKGGNHQGQARQLLGAWISETPSNNLAYQTLRLAMQHDIEQGLSPALRIMEQKNISSYMRMFALLAVGKLGRPHHAEQVAKLLSDATVCSSRTTVVNGKRTTYRIELRDVAVAVLVHMTNQSLKDYDMDQVRNDPNTLFNTGTLGFSEESNRDAAIQKMKDWLKDHPEVLAQPGAGATPSARTSDDQGGNPADVVGQQKPAPQHPPAPQQPVPQPAPGNGVIPAPAQPQAAPANRVPANPAPIKAAPPNPARIKPAAANAVQAKAAALPLAAMAFVQVVPASDAVAANDEEALADRELATYLAKAQQLLESENYPNALLLLDHVLGAEQGGLIRPTLDVPLYQSLRAEAERTLSELPAVARESYELRFGPVARKELDRALGLGDLEAVQHVIRRYRFTQAGAEASLVWARHLLDCSRPLSAAITLERLQQNWAAPPFDSATAWHHALSWLQAGMFQEARSRLTSLTDAQRRDLELAGLPVEMAGLLRRFADGRVAPEEHSSDWLLVRGDARRSGRPSPGGLPWLRARWSVATAEGEPIQAATKSLQQLYREHHFGAIPTAQPLAVGNRLLARTVSGLLAIDVASGQTLWHAAFDDGVKQLLIGEKGSLTANSQALLTGLDERGWGDLTYGTMSSDGEHVFGVEDVGFTYGLLNQRIMVGPDGSRRLDPGWPRDYSRLTAYHVETGKLVWEIGGPKGALGLPLAGTYFLGPPLPLADSLYVVGEVDQRIYLLVLDRRNGRLRRRQLLNTLDSDPYARVQIYNGLMPRREARRMSGASPSYADGILVCPVAGDKFVAVDLGTGEVRWTFQPEHVSSPRHAIFGGMRQNVNQVDHRQRRWVDTCVSLSAGRALLTPQGRDAVYCLDLQSGRLYWEAPRLDSQFLATVQEGRLLLAGRSSVRSLALETGADNWPAVPLPAGGSPAGRGFASGGNYYLPLNTGEVAVVDLALGRMPQLTRSLTGSRPGNLISCGDRIVSQAVDRIEAYDQIQVALAETAARVAEQPRVARHAIDHAELLLFSGAHRPALDLLLEHYQRQPDDALRQRICATIVAGLAADFATFRPLATEHAGLFQSADEQQARLQATAAQLARRGESLPAFDALLQMTRIAGAENADVTNGDLVNRRDRWLAGRMADVFARAAADARPELERTLAEAQKAAFAKSGTAALERYLDCFGWHPSATAIRQELVARLDAKEVLPRENHLLQLAASPDSSIAGSAVAQLAQMHTATERPDAAASLYRRLGSQFATVVCQNGKTGTQILAELPTNLPVSRLLHREDFWPSGRVDVTKGSNRVTSYQRAVPLEIDTAQGVPQGDLRLEGEQNGANQRILAQDSQGNVRWRFQLPTTENSTRSYNAGLLRIRTAGHLAIVHRGDEFFAIDMAFSGKEGENEGARLLWRANLEAKLPGDSPMQGFSQWLQQRPGRFPRLQAIDPYNGETAELDAVTPTVVCYHKMQTLYAVDPLTGRPLWKRFDLKTDSEIVGDGEVILILPPDAGEARILRAFDGRELGQAKAPAGDVRIGSVGRNLLTWVQDQQGSRLTLDDVWQGRQLWQHTFSAAAKYWMISTDEIAVLDPVGRFALLSLHDGRPRVDEQIDPEPNLTEMFVVRGSDHYLLFANSPQAIQGNVNPVPGGYFCPLVGGNAYGFDRFSGKRLWKTPLPLQLSFDITQPADSPIAVLASRVYEQNGNRITRQYSPLVCLDKRTGRIVHQEELAGSISRVEQIPNPGGKSVEIRTNASSIKLTLTSEPWEN